MDLCPLSANHHSLNQTHQISSTCAPMSAKDQAEMHISSISWTSIMSALPGHQSCQHYLEIGFSPTSTETILRKLSAALELLLKVLINVSTRVSAADRVCPKITPSSAKCLFNSLWNLSLILNRMSAEFACIYARDIRHLSNKVKQ